MVRDGERARVRREDRVLCTDRVELHEEIPLRIQSLDDRLDDDISIRERAQLSREGEACPGSIPLSPRGLLPLDGPVERLPNPSLSSFEQLLIQLANHDFEPTSRRHLRHTTPHQAAAYDTHLPDLQALSSTLVLRQGIHPHSSSDRHSLTTSRATPPK